MRKLVIVTLACALLGGIGCGILPGTDEATQRRFWGGDCPNEILQMDPPKPAETKPGEAKPAAGKDGTP